MAFSSVRALGRGAVSKTIQLKLWGIREFASTVFLSTKSGDGEKEQKEPKMQQPPKNVVAPKEGAKLLLPASRAEFPKKLSSPNSYPSAVNKGKTIVNNINSDDIKQQTDEEVSKLLPGKNVAELTPKVSTSSLRVKNDEADLPYSSSDSDSDREDGDLKSQIAVKIKGEFPQQEVFETRTQKAHMDSMHWEKPLQSEMKLTEQSETYKEPKIPKSEMIGSFKDESTKEAQMQNSIFHLNEVTKENQKLVENNRNLSDQMEGGSSTQLDMGSKLSIAKKENSKEKPTAIDFTEDHFEQKDILQKQIPIPNLEAPPQTREGILEENVPTVNTGTEEEVFQVKLKSQDIMLGSETAETFDNSTYKNLQHHNYNTYTFLDFYLDILKFRLPQPSSGRESPRH
ncbi:NADH dehydrogenase [ubiquinone] flavoprotein 3, mitochondrial [Macrotis lagotis]|uniref:NADH dehydrogenase [ubiquinone] flavoprotein 3, mitochondrial n=1 Tax=Macrotis lagotis TaxID=92651 RepID=UPI003D681E3D